MSWHYQTIDESEPHSVQHEAAGAQPYPNLRRTMAEGRIDGSRKPDPSKRTLRAETNESEAQ